jgi:hypothetical protein
MADDVVVSEGSSSPATTEAPAEGQAKEASAATEAARTLAARRAEIRGKLGKDSAGPKAGATASGNAPNADSSSSSGQGGDSKPSSATAQTPPAAKQEAKADAGSDEIAALIREDRRIKAEGKKLAEERAALEAARKEVDEYTPRVKAAQAALAKGDKVSAIKALFPDEDLTTDLFWDLAKQLGEDAPAQAAIDPEKVAEMALERLEAKRKAEQDAEAAKKAEAAKADDAALEEARNEYLAEANKEFQRNIASFNGMTRLFKLIGSRATTVINERIIEVAEEHGRATGRVLSIADAMAKVNAELAADQQEAAANDNGKPAANVTGKWQSDPGRPAGKDSKDKSLDEIRAERKAALRAGR